jgi:hypothetical protein
VALLAVAKLLTDYGPQLGRPYADTLKGSRHANMKELRFEGADGEWRAAFAFDPERRAILLVAGDKSGGSQKCFYRKLIAKADRRRESEMGRNLNDFIAALPSEQQAAMDASYQDLKQKVEGLRELRQIAGKAQADIATALNIKQPSVSKIEKQADMYLSTLRSYVEAVGGNLELVVRLPARAAIRLQSLGEIGSLPATGKSRMHSRTKSGAATKLAAKAS